MPKPLLSDQNDLVDTWVDNDGKLHIRVAADVVWHLGGNETKIVEGSTATFADGLEMHMASIHHVQPSGADFHDRVYAPEFGPDPDLREKLVERDRNYRTHDEKSKRRAFYLGAARRNLMRKRKSKRGCSCGG